MSANPVANGGCLLRDLEMPDFRDYAVPVPAPGAVVAETTRVQGQFIRDVMRLNMHNFRVFSPDETASNRWDAVFEVTNRCSSAEIARRPTSMSRADGRVMEMLSEHQCEGWLEGYLLTGRHGIFSCYEAFIHIVDSMFNQHAKWLKAANRIAWRRPVASLNYLLSSHVWRQDHNGASHQDPGFIDHVLNKKPEIVRVYLPPDANTLLCGHRPLPAQPQLHQRHRRRQAPGAAVAGHRRRRQRIAAPASAPGNGPATAAATRRTSSWPAPATCRRSKRWPRCNCCASTSRT